MIASIGGLSVIGLPVAFVLIVVFSILIILHRRTANGGE